jgi:hypothetical protein
LSPRAVATPLKIENAGPRTGNLDPAPSAFPARALPPFFSIPDLAKRWCCSRASVYNRIRSEKILDFAASGRKGHQLVPLDIVLKIERAHLRVLR